MKEPSNEHGNEPEGAAPPVSPEEAPSPPIAQEQVGSYHLLGREAQHQSRGLFNLGVVSIGSIAIYLAYASEVVDIAHLYIAEAILLLSSLPMLLWLRQGGSRFPAFEPMMLLCANAYAWPLVSGHRQLAQFPASTITWAGLCVIVYQLAAIAIYYGVGGHPGRGRFWRESIINNQVERLVTYGIVVSTAYIAISEFTDLVPAELSSVLRAVFYGISILCTFITMQRWGRGELGATERRVFGLFLVVQLFLMASGLLMIGAITLVGIAFFAYLSGGKKVPWIPIVLLFASIAVLHNGKSTMRRIYWDEGKPSPTLTQLPIFYWEWFNHGLTISGGSSGEEEASIGAKLLARTSLMHMMCLVVEYTPSRQPYLEGETYWNVPPQLIPRFFWPDKPRSHVSTYRLSVYYGLQDESATQKATIAFGMVSEAYANFGMLGTLMLGLFFGFAYKKMQVLSSQSPMFSLAGLTMVLLSAWSLSAELTMAAWVSSFYQALIAVLGVPILLRAMFGF